MFYEEKLVLVKWLTEGEYGLSDSELLRSWSSGVSADLLLRGASFMLRDNESLLYGAVLEVPYSGFIKGQLRDTRSGAPLKKCPDRKFARLEAFKEALGEWPSQHAGEVTCVPRRITAIAVRSGSTNAHVLNAINMAKSMCVACTFIQAHSAGYVF